MNGKRNALITALVVILVVFLLCGAVMVLEHFLLFSKYIVLSQSTSLYFFSALFQGNAALFAILGVFVVFRLQIERSSIGSIEQILLKDLGEFFGGEAALHIALSEFLDFKRASPEKKRSLAGDYAKDCKERHEDHSRYAPSHLLLPDLLNTWIESDQRIREIKAQIKLPIYILATYMALSLAGLISATPIHRFWGAVEPSGLSILD